MNVETKVGIFVVIGAVLIAALGIIFGKIDFSDKEGITVSFSINDATGIKKGTPIMYKGIKVGEVNDVTFSNKELVTTVTIYKKYEIPDNIKFTVKQSGFVGQKYVEFEDDPYVAPKSALRNNYLYDGKQHSVNMDAVIAKLNLVAEEMTILLRSINSVVTTDNSQTALKDTIGNIKSITDSISSLISSNDAKFNAVINNAKKMSEVMERILAKNETSINQSIGNINELTTNLKELSRSIDSLLKNNEGNIDSSLQNLKEITDKFNSTMDDVDKIMKDINEGNGTLGLLINDKETKDNVKKVVKGMSSFFSDSDDENGGFRLYGSIGADYIFDGNTVNTGRGYAGVSLYTDPKNFYTISVANIPVITPHGALYDFKGNRVRNSDLAISVQYSHIFYNILGLRFGIFDNTLGLATDIYPLKNNDLAISLEAYDFNVYKTRLDVYTRAYIRWHFYKGFFIQGGVEDVLGNINRVYMVGAGVRFSPSELKKLADNTDKKNNISNKNEISEQEYDKKSYEETKDSDLDKNTDNIEPVKIKHNDKYYDSLVY